MKLCRRVQGKQGNARFEDAADIYSFGWGFI
jgi:hypothetical protein